MKWTQLSRNEFEMELKSNLKSNSNREFNSISFHFEFQNRGYGLWYHFVLLWFYCVLVPAIVVGDISIIAIYRLSTIIDSNDR